MHGPAAVSALVRCLEHQLGCTLRGLRIPEGKGTRAKQGLVSLASDAFKVCSTTTTCPTPYKACNEGMLLHV